MVATIPSYLAENTVNVSLQGSSELNLLHLLYACRCTPLHNEFASTIPIDTIPIATIPSPVVGKGFSIPGNMRGKAGNW